MKDAKGHGSNSRGGTLADRATQAKRRAMQTHEMQETLSAYKQIIPGKNAGRSLPPAANITDQDAAHVLARGGAKSAQVPIHGGAIGRGRYDFGPNWPS